MRTKIKKKSEYNAKEKESQINNITKNTKPQNKSGHKLRKKNILNQENKSLY